MQKASDTPKFDDFPDSDTGEYPRTTGTYEQLEISPVYKDAFYLTVDPGDCFQNDVKAALSHSGSRITELRLFVNPIHDKTPDSCEDTKLIAGLEDILSQNREISRLFFHAGHYQGNGMDGFDPTGEKDGKGRLTTVSKLVLHLFAKQKSPLRILCIGGYQSLNGERGQYQGSDITVSEVFSLDLPCNILESLESFEVGINLPQSGTNSPEEQYARMTTEVDALRRVFEKLLNAKSMTLRWDQLNPQVEQQISDLVKKTFPSHVLDSIGPKPKLEHLALRGFERVAECTMRSLLDENPKLEQIEIAKWDYYLYGSRRSYSHCINYSQATSTAGSESVAGTAAVKAAPIMGNEHNPPCASAGRANSIIDQLLSRKLVEFINVAGDVTEELVQEQAKYVAKNAERKKWKYMYSCVHKRKVAAGVRTQPRRSARLAR